MRLSVVALSLCVAGGLPAFAQDAGTETPPELRDFRLDPPPRAPAPEPTGPTPLPPQDPTETQRAEEAPPAQPASPANNPRSLPPAQSPQQRPTTNAPAEDDPAEPDVEAALTLPQQTADTRAIPEAPLSDVPPTERSTDAGFSGQQAVLAALLLLLTLAVAFFIWRRRSQHQWIAGATPVKDTPSAPEIRITPPVIPPVIPQTAAPVPSDIKMALVPHYAAVSVKSLIMKGTLQITNNGSAPADQLTLRAGIVSASRHQQAAIDNFFANPQNTASSPILSVKPEEEIGLNIELSIALDEMQTFTVGDKSLLVPIFVASLSSSAGEVARITCMVGREASPPQAKMGPLRLDQGPRSFDRLGQRALVS